LLLLDEAGVFLRERPENSQKNSLVLVFLRKLEYFKGIMLLTTNRVIDFDNAVQSRIHIGLTYSSLGPDTRKKLWVSFLEKMDTVGKVISYSIEELQDLAKHDLNGRQVSFLRWSSNQRPYTNEFHFAD